MSKISNNLTGISFAKSFMSCLCYTPQGKLDLAYELSEESVKIAQKSNDIFAMGMAYSTHGIICYHRGLFEYSEECLLKSLVLNERAGAISQRSLALGYLGYVYLDKGKNEKAQAYLKESIESKYNPSWIVIFELSLIKAEVLSRKRNIILKDLSKYNEKNRLKAFSGFNARFISEIFMNIDDTHIAEAKFWIAKAVEMDQRNGIKWSLGMDYSVYAELFNRKGDSSKTKEYLCKAIEIFKECGADGWVEKYEKELTEL